MVTGHHKCHSINTQLAAKHVSVFSVLWLHLTLFCILFQYLYEWISYPLRPSPYSAWWSPHSYSSFLWTLKEHKPLGQYSTVQPYVWNIQIKQYQTSLELLNFFFIQRWSRYIWFNVSCRNTGRDNVPPNIIL